MRKWIVLAVLAGLALPQAAHAAGDRILFLSNRAEGARELYLVDRDGSALQRLTFNDIIESQPVWSPDRSRIAFAGLRGVRWDIYTVAADGSDLRQVTSDAVRDNWPNGPPTGASPTCAGSCPARAVRGS